MVWSREVKESRLETHWRIRRVLSCLARGRLAKSTLAQDIVESCNAVYLDVERTADRQVLEEPDLYLDEQLGRLVVIDEVQLLPDLFKSLRGQIDRRRRQGHRTGQFLLLGSASNTLLHQSAESLAGRVSYHELTPFMLPEIGVGAMSALWLRGGFPDSFLAKSVRGQPHMAGGFHPDLSGTRHPVVRVAYSRGNVAAVLDHARS